MRRSGALYRRRSPENCCPGTRYSRSTSRADDNQGTGLRPSCKGSRGPGLLSKCCCSSCPSTSAGVGVGCRCGAAVRGDRSGRGQSARGAAGQRAEIAAAQATHVSGTEDVTSDGTVCENLRTGTAWAMRREMSRTSSSSDRSASILGRPLKVEGALALGMAEGETGERG